MPTPDETDHTVQVAAPPGGRLLAAAKRGAEHLLWARVAVQRRVEERRGHDVSRPVPTAVPPTAVLDSEVMWRSAVEQRSEERRVGKEGRSRGAADRARKK